MAKDPVCKMDVSEEKAAEKSEYKGKTYYFCAKAGLPLREALQREARQI